MGQIADRYRHALDRDVRHRDDRTRLCDFVVRRALVRPDLVALYRPRAVHRPDRQCRPQRAALCLCQPLVRQAARLGAGPDRERPIHRGRALAADLRARDRELWLAQHHARVRPVSGGRSSCRSRLSSSSIRPKSRLPPSTATRGSKARPCSAGRQSRVRHAGGRIVLLLRPDGDAAGPSGRALQRSRHPADRTAPRCSPCCSAPRSSAGRCGAGFPTASAGS